MRVGPVAALLVVFAFWVVGLALDVAELRAELSTRIVWLMELQELHQAVDEGRDLPELELSWTELAATLDADARVHAHAAADAVEASATSSLPEHLNALVPAIRGQTAGISRTLGARWDQMNLLSAIALVLATALLASLVWAQRELQRRRTAEDALADGEARYARLGVGLALVNGEGVLYTSPALEELATAWTSVEDWWREVRSGVLPEVGPEERPGEVCPACGQPERSGTRLADVRRPDGERAVFELTWGGHAHELGHRGDLLLVRDTTRRHELEAQVRVADRLASVGTLAAGVAHEINNPLSYVIANLHVLSSELVLPESEQLERAELLAALADAREGADRVRTVVTDLQSFGHQVQQDGAVDLAGVVRSTARLADHHLRHRAKLVLDLEADAPRVAGVEARVGQIVLNLLVNAAQALPDEARGTHVITVRTRTVGGMGELTVQDDGPGIPPEHQARIFDPFFTTKPQGVGTGLGLYVCHRIASELGGSIQVSSVPGCTVFRVWLPTCDVASAPPREAAPLPRGLRVLLVDDEPGVGRAFRRVLRDAEVIVAPDLSAAVAAWRPDIDVVICDVNLGADRGPDLLDALPIEPSRVVFLTGGVLHDDDRAALDAHPNAPLHKPFEPDEVRRALHSALLPSTQARAG